MKKLCTLLALIMLLTCISVTGCTEEPQPNPATDFEYEIRDDGGIIITKYIGEGSHVIIPQIIDGKEVTTIGEHSFAGTPIQSIQMPDTIKYIYSYAFGSCDGLSEIEMSASLISIAQRAFFNCISLTYIDLSMDTIQYIDYEVFLDCINIKTVIFGDNIVRIRDKAFYGCSSLEEIILPKNLQEIGEYAFGNCNSVQKIWIPKTLEKWGFTPFLGIQSVSEIIFEDGLKQIGSINDIFCYGGQMETITIPASVEFITEAAFVDCMKLKENYFEGAAPQIGTGKFINFVTPEQDVKIYYDPAMPGWDTTPLREIYSLVPLS